MKTLLISLSLLIFEIGVLSAHSLSKIEYRDKDIYEVNEDKHSSSIRFINPKPKKPTLREIVYYHLIERPYDEEQDHDTERPGTNGHGLQFIDVDQKDHKDQYPKENGDDIIIPPASEVGYEGEFLAESEVEDQTQPQPEEEYLPEPEVEDAAKPLPQKHPSDLTEEEISQAKVARKLLFDQIQQKYKIPRMFRFGQDGVFTAAPEEVYEEVTYAPESEAELHELPEKVADELVTELPPEAKIPEEVEIPQATEIPQKVEIPQEVEISPEAEIPQEADIPKVEIPSNETPLEEKLPEVADLVKHEAIPEAEVPQEVEIPKRDKLPKWGDITPEVEPEISQPEVPKETEIPIELEIPQEGDLPQKGDLPQMYEVPLEPAILQPEVPQETELPQEGEIPQQGDLPQEGELTQVYELPQEPEISQPEVLKEIEIPHEVEIPQEGDLTKVYEVPQEPKLPQPEIPQEGEIPQATEGTDESGTNPEWTEEDLKQIEAKIAYFARKLLFDQVKAKYYRKAKSMPCASAVQSYRKKREADWQAMPEAPKLGDLNLGSLPEYIRNAYEEPKPAQPLDKDASILEKVRRRIEAIFANLRPLHSKVKRDAPLTYGMKLTGDHGYVWNDLAKPGVAYNVGDLENISEPELIQDATEGPVYKHEDHTIYNEPVPTSYPEDIAGNEYQETTLAPEFPIEEGTPVPELAPEEFTPATDPEYHPDEVKELSTADITEAPFIEPVPAPEENLGKLTLDEVLKNEQLWQWFGEWTSTYVDLLSQHINKLVKEEVELEIKSYLERQKDEKEETNHLIPEIEPIEQDVQVMINGKAIPVTRESNFAFESSTEPGAELLRRRPSSGKIEAQNIYGNSQGNEKVTNIFVFYNNNNYTNGIISLGSGNKLNIEEGKIPEEVHPEPEVPAPEIDERLPEISELKPDKPIPDVAPEPVIITPTPEVVEKPVEQLVPELPAVPEITPESDLAPEAIGEIVSEIPEVSEPAPEEVSKPALEEASAVVSDKVFEPAPKEIPAVAEVSEPISEVTEIPAQVSEVAPETVSEKKTGVSEAAPVEVSEIVPEVVSEVIPEQESEPAPEKTSEAIPEIASEASDKEVTELATEIAEPVSITPEDASIPIETSSVSNVAPEISETTPEVSVTTPEVSETTPEVTETTPEVVEAPKEELSGGESGPTEAIITEGEKPSSSFW